MLLYSIFSENWVMLVASLIAYVSAILVAMSFHEFAHAYVANKQGDPTAKAMKRLTLKPFTHVDIWGFVCLLLFGFGWAKPVPVDPRNFKHGRRSDFLVSIAGVTTNLIISLVASLIYCLLYCIWPAFALGSNFYTIALELFLNYSIFINLSLVFFNLIPIYPLDGYRIVESIAGENNGFSSFMKRYGYIFMLVLYFTGLFSLYINVTAFNLGELFVKMWLKLFSLMGL